MKSLLFLALGVGLFVAPQKYTVKADAIYMEPDTAAVQRLKGVTEIQVAPTKVSLQEWRDGEPIKDAVALPVELHRLVRDTILQTKLRRSATLRILGKDQRGTQPAAVSVTIVGTYDRDHKLTITIELSVRDHATVDRNRERFLAEVYKSRATIIKPSRAALDRSLSDLIDTFFEAWTTANQISAE